MRLVAIGFAYEKAIKRKNGTRGINDIEDKAGRDAANELGRERVSMAGRVAASEVGAERVSITKKCRALSRGILSCRNDRRISFLILS